MYSHCVWIVLDTWKILFFGKERFFEKIKSMLLGETNVLEYLFTIFMGREAKRLYLCASNKYDFLRRGGAESKGRARKIDKRITSRVEAETESLI